MMAGYAPSFLGNTDRSVSGFSVDQSVKNCLQDVEDNIIQEDEIEDPPLSPHHPNLGKDCNTDQWSKYY